MTQAQMDALLDRPFNTTKRSVMVRLSREQAARMDAVKYASFEEQEMVYQSIFQEVEPELERLKRLQTEE